MTDIKQIAVLAVQQGKFTKKYDRGKDQTTISFEAPAWWDEVPAERREMALKLIATFAPQALDDMLDD